MWVSMVVVMVEGSDGTPETQSPGHCECEARDREGVTSPFLQSGRQCHLRVICHRPVHR